MSIKCTLLKLTTTTKCYIRRVLCKKSLCFFLQFYNFDYTLGILSQEANIESKKITRDSLIKRYNVPREKSKSGKPLLNSFFFEGGSSPPKTSFNNYSDHSDPITKKEPLKSSSHLTVDHSKSKGLSIPEDEEKPMKFSFQPPSSSVKSGSSSNALLTNITSNFGGKSSNYDFDLDNSGKESGSKLTFEMPKKAGNLDPLKGPSNIKSAGSTLTSLPSTGLNSGNKKYDTPNYSFDKFDTKDQKDDSYKYEDDFEIEEDIQEDLEFEFSRDDKQENKVTSSEDYNLASQSMGIDKSVDFFTIEDYDYYEPVKPKR